MPLGGTYGTEQGEDWCEQHEHYAGIEQIDAPVVRPDDEQCDQNCDGAGYREQPATDLAVPVPRPSVHNQRKHSKPRKQLAEKKAFVLPEKAKTQCSAQRAQTRKAADRKSAVEGKSEEVGVARGGRQT